MKSEVVKNLFERYLLSNNKLEDTKHLPLKENEFFAGSSGQCSRALYFSKKIKTEVTIDSLKIFCIGNLLHDFVQSQIFSSGKSEVPIVIEENGIKIRGRLDYLLGDVIYEIKTIKELNYVLDEPKDEHRRQLNIYLKSQNLKNGVLLYIEKNSLKTVEHIIVFNQKLFDDSMRQFELVYKSILEKKPPERLENYPDNWKCRYCSFRNFCQE